MRIEIIYICVTVGGILINSMELKSGQVNLLQTEPKSSDIRSHKTNKTPEVLIFNDFGRYSCGGRIFKMLANADKIGVTKLEKAVKRRITVRHLSQF